VDSLGFLWMTTEGGLTCFDGNRFITIRPTKSNNGTQRMRDFIRTADGLLFITDARGNLLMEHGHRNIFQIASGPRFRMNGEVPGMQPLLAMLDTGSTLGRSIGTGGRRLFDLGEGRWGILGDDRFWLLRDTAIVAHWPSDFPFARCWLQQGQLVAQAAGGQWMSIDPATGARRMLRRIGDWPMPAAAPVSMLAPAQPGLAYFVADHKLFRLEARLAEGTVAAVDTGVDLPVHVAPACIARLNHGHVLAIGTANAGLLLYHRKQIEVLHARTRGERISAYYAQAQLPDGDLLVAGVEHLLRFRPNGEPHVYASLPAPEWVSMARVADGRVLIALQGRLCLFDPIDEGLTVLDVPPVRPSAFYPEGDSIWVGNSAWLGYLDNGLRFRETFSIASNADRDRPIAMARDKQGLMLIATCAALLRAKDRTCSAFDTIPGSEGLCTRCISVQPEGVFIGTYGNGLFRLSDSDSLHPVPHDPLNALQYTHAIVRDDKGRFWISTNQGIVRCNATDLGQPATNPSRSPHFTYLRKLHGMEAAELNGGTSPPSLLLADGRISFSSMSGIVRFHPDSVADPYAAPGFLVDNLRVDGRTLPVNEYVVLRAGDRELTFDVSMAYWGDPVNAQLEYRIPGLQDEWLPVDLTVGTISVARPTPGTYAVHVRPVGSDEVLDDAHAQAYFKVPLPFWRTPVGYLVLLLAMALLIMLMVRLQSARLIRQRLELSRLVDARTAELDQRNRELLRSIEAREGLMAVISHDIVTPLRFIARAARSAVPMVGAQRDSDLRETLSELSDSAEKLRGNASALLDWIKHNPDRMKPAIAELDLHAEAERAIAIWQVFADERGLLIENRVPMETMIRSDRILLQVVLGNLIGNAVNHAREARFIWIECDRDDGTCRIQVADDGAGMGAKSIERARAVLMHGWDEVTPHHVGTDGQGIGLAIAASLTNLLGGSLRLESRPGHTAFTVQLPG
jgi:signal transduction histidine kinase